MSKKSLSSIRFFKKSGERYSEKEIQKKNPVLFGGLPYDIDKKVVVHQQVSEMEPQIVWIYDKYQKLKKENFDMSDAYACVWGGMRKCGDWK